MKEIGRPTGLIAYDTDINGQRRQAGKPPIYRLIRARTILYAAVIVAVGGLMLYALATRSPINVSVLHDRNPLFVLLSDGGVRNNYMVRILNKGERRTFTLDVSGLPGAQLHSPGIEPRADGKIAVDVGQDQTREVRLSVQVSSGMVPGNPVRIDIRATDAATGLAAAAADHFVPPGQ